jgi:hypothetical protein
MTSSRSSNIGVRDGAVTCSSQEKPHSDLSQGCRKSQRLKGRNKIQSAIPCTRSEKKQGTKLNNEERSRLHAKKEETTRWRRKILSS